MLSLLFNVVIIFNIVFVVNIVIVVNVVIVVIVFVVICVVVIVVVVVVIVIVNVISVLFLFQISKDWITCGICDDYFPSWKVLKRHRENVHANNVGQIEDLDESFNENLDSEMDR
jgi:hypothetical protein